jgi:hypothetical protein
LGDTYFKLAYHAFLSATYTDAEQWIQEGLSHGGNQVDLNFLGGRTMRALQHHEAAATYWQGYLAALSARAHGDARDIGMSTNFDGPDALQEAWKGLAAAIVQVGGPTAVAPVLAEWRDLMPDDPEPLSQQIWLDLRQERPAEAFARYQSRPATMVPSDWLDASGMLAALNSRQPGAEAMARTMLTRQPVRWLLHDYLGRWLAMQRRHAEAASLITAWQRWVPGDPRAIALQNELKLPPSVTPGPRPTTPAVLGTLITTAKQAMQSGQWQPATADALCQQAEAAGDPIAALWATGEAWALQPENPEQRERYLALRPKGIVEAGTRWLIEGPPDADAVARLRELLQQRGLHPVRWDRPLATGEAALILAMSDADLRRRWLDVLPQDWPLVIAVDPRMPAGWTQTAAYLSQGHVALPILPTHAIPGTADSPNEAVRRWQTFAADTLAPIVATGQMPWPRLIQTDADGHTDLAAAALQALGTVACLHPGSASLDAGYWLPMAGALQPNAGDGNPWPWVFPLGGMWLSAPPAVMSGPFPVPEAVLCGGRSCRIQRTESGWTAKLPDLGPGWHEVTAKLPTGTVSWRFGCSPLP